MSSWELPSEDCQKFVCIQQCLLCMVTQKWLWSTWENLWMDDIDCFIGTSRCRWLGGEICMLVRGKCVLEVKTKIVGVCPRTIEGITRNFETEDQPYISSFYQARRILRVAVRWVGSWHMHVATDFIAKVAVCDLKYLRKDSIQNCLGKLNLRFVSSVFCERLPF